MGEMADYCNESIVENYYDDYDEILSGVEILHETDKARLVFHGGMIAWFPKSISNIELFNTLVYEGWFLPEWKKSAQQKSMTPIEGDFE